jgi:hypothetical protein
MVQLPTNPLLLAVAIELNRHRRRTTVFIAFRAFMDLDAKL